MKRVLFAVLLLATLATASQAQYVKVLGIAEQSAKIITSGVSSTTSAAKTFPGATITILNANGTNATIYSDAAGTPKSNSYQASLTDATYDFFIRPGAVFSVRVSGTSGGVAISAFTRSLYTAPGTFGFTQVLCGGTNDTTLLGAASSAGGTIQIPNTITCASNSQTISAVLQVDNGGLLKPLTGQTVTLTGPQIGDTWQRFTNATAGLGTISLTGNVSLKEVYAQWWGAKGDNSTDNAATILAAGTAAITAGVPLHLITGTYKVNSELTFNGALKMYGDGESTVWDASGITHVNGEIITITGSTGVSTTLSSDAAYLDTLLHVGSSTGIVAGDRLMIKSVNQAFSPTNSAFKRGEQVTVASVGAGTITIVGGLKEGYTAASTVNITKINGINNPYVKNLKIIGGGAAKQQHAIYCWYADRARFENVFIDQVEDVGISLRISDNSVIENSHAQNMFGTTNGVGYAFAADLLSQNFAVRGNTTNNVSSSFSVGDFYPVWNGVVSGNRFQNGTSSRAMIQTHINGTGVVVVGNTVSGGVIGIAMSGPGNSVNDNIVTQMSSRDIYFLEDGTIRGQAVGNKGTGIAGIVVDGTDVVASGTTSSMMISSNDLRAEPFGSAGPGISINSPDVTVSNNRLRGFSPGILVVDAAYSRINDNDIADTRSNTASPYAIYLFSSGSPVSGVVVRNNHTHSDIASETTYAILIAAGLTDTRVEGNNLDDVNVGPYIQDNGARTAIQNNMLGSDQQGVYVDASVAVAVATTTSKVKTTATATYNLNQRYYTKAATDNFWDLSGLSTDGTHYMKVVLAIDDSGNAVVIQGQKSTAQTTARVPNYIPVNAAPVASIEIPNSYSGGSLAGFVFHNLIGKVN